MSAKRRNWGGGFPCKPESLNFPLLLDKNITYRGKKVSLLAFRHVLTKILPAACNQLHNYDLFEKVQLKLSPLAQNSDYLPRNIISQNHMPGISLLNKNFKKLFHPPGVDCPSFPWTFMGSPGDWGKSYPTSKYVPIFPIRKIPLNRFKSFAIKSLISSPSNSNFQVITLCNIHL